MTRLCQHCATPYAEDSGVDGFCCPGCQQVYTLIQNEGLEDYYRRQDRAAQPLKDRKLSDVDAAAMRRVQLELEAQRDFAEAVFPVEGMSCMGCAWLIERLAGNQSGLVEADSSLTAHTVRLQWRASTFDLAAFAGELLRFGYRLEAKPLTTVSAPRMSPLALRLFMCAVFTGNTLLLAAYTHFIGGSTLINLLSLTCLCFTLLLGAAPFFLAAYRALRIRRWHSDWIPVGLITGSVCFSGLQVYIEDLSVSTAVFCASFVVSLLLAARVLSKRFA